MAQLQRIQNNSARLIFHKKCSEHVRPMLISLHWCPIKQHTEYKLVTLASRFDGIVPLPLTPSLLICSHRFLQSPSDKLPSVPHVNFKSAGARSIQYWVPCLQNSVLIQICFSTSFKCSFKMYLFRTAFT